MENKLYFVAKSGDDTNTGTEAVDPFRTVTHAKSIAEDGDIVILLDKPKKEGLECARKDGKSWKKGVYKGVVPRTIFVRSDGDDENDGTADRPAAALRTLAAAVEMANPDDRIVLDPTAISAEVAKKMVVVDEELHPAYDGSIGDHNYQRGRSVFVEDYIGRKPPKPKTDE